MLGAQAREARAQTPRVTVTTGKSSPEEYAAFRERAAQGKQAIDDQFALCCLQPRERRFAELIRRYYTEAQWMLVVHQFPDGRCQREQSRWDLLLWTLFINAARERGAEGS